MFDDDIPNPGVLGHGVVTWATAMRDIDDWQWNRPDKDYRDDATGKGTYNSFDFLQTGNVRDDIASPVFSDSQVDAYREIATADGSDWEYIGPGSTKWHSASGNVREIYVKELDSTYVFLDPPKILGTEDNYKVKLDFNKGSSSGWLAWFINLWGDFYTKFINNSYHSVVIVSPSDLDVTLDSAAFKKAADDAHILLMSSGTIDFRLDPVDSMFVSQNDAREISALLMAGEDINFVTVPFDFTVEGIVNAGDNIWVEIEIDEDENPYNLKHPPAEQHFTVKQDGDVIDSFPDSWAFIGQGPIVSYRYIN